MAGLIKFYKLDADGKIHPLADHAVSNGFSVDCSAWPFGMFYTVRENGRPIELHAGFLNHAQIDAASMFVVGGLIVLDAAGEPVFAPLTGERLRTMFVDEMNREAPIEIMQNVYNVGLVPTIMGLFDNVFRSPGSLFLPR